MTTQTINASLSQKIKTLFANANSVEIGKDFFVFSKGWLWLDDQGDCWVITHASGKTSHNRAGGALAYAAAIDKKSGAHRGSGKTAITMHPVRDPQEATGIFNHIAKQIDQALEYHKLSDKKAPDSAQGAPILVA